MARSKKGGSIAPVVSPEQIARDLKIEDHLRIMAANGLRVDVSKLADPDEPAVEIITGILFRHLTDRDNSFLVLAKRHADGVEGVYEGRRGDPLLDFPLEIFGAWSRYDGTEAVFIDPEDQTIIEMAAPLAVYGADGCTVPEHPIDCVVFWKYRDGRKVDGLALPYDLDKADAEGWFLRAAAEAGAIRTQVRLYPALSRLRKRAGRVEPQGIHPSGLRIVSPLPAIAGWGEQVEALLTQRSRVLIAVPLPSVGTTEAAEAIEEVSADTTAIELGDGIEVGPEEIRVARGDIRSIWDVLLAVHQTHGVQFDPITRDASRAHIRAAHRAVASAIHPDKLRGRLAGMPNVPANVADRIVAQANVQWVPLDAAFRKALAVRDAEMDLVKAGLESVALDPDALAEARKAKEGGADAITELVASALGVPFDWAVPNHVALRKRVLDILRDRAKAAGKEEDAQPDETPATEEPEAPAAEGEPAAT